MDNYFSLDNFFSQDNFLSLDNVFSHPRVTSEKNLLKVSPLARVTSVRSKNVYSLTHSLTDWLWLTLIISGASCAAKNGRKSSTKSAGAFCGSLDKTNAIEEPVDGHDDAIDVDNAIVEDIQNIDSLWFIRLLLNSVLWFFHNPILSNKTNTLQVLYIIPHWP